MSISKKDLEKSSKEQYEQQQKIDENNQSQYLQHECTKKYYGGSSGYGYFAPGKFNKCSKINSIVDRSKCEDAVYSAFKKCLKTGK